MGSSPDKRAPTLPERKPNRLPLGIYFGKQFFFVTICAKDRRKVFTDGEMVGALADLLHEKCTTKGFALYAYCFMPDHLHAELLGMSDNANLQAVIRAFKGAATAVARRFGVSNLWQKGFYDHIVRAGDNPDSVAAYIFQNPVRAGLVKHWLDWPFSESAVFSWQNLRAVHETFVPPWKIRT